MSGVGPERPAEEVEGATAGARARPGPAARIEVRSILRESWGIFRSIWPACLFVYWGAGAASWLILNFLVLVLAAFNLAIGDPTVTPFLEFLSFLGLVLVPSWLWMGQTMAYLKLARREPVALEDLFRGGPFLLTALLAGGAFLAGAAIPCLVAYGSTEALLKLRGAEPLISTIRRLLPAQMPMKATDLDERLVDLMSGILLVAYAAFFAVRVRLRTFPFLIVDRDAGVPESFRTSIQLSRGRVWTIFLIHLAQSAINLAGLLACWMGLIVSLPLTGLISAVTYNALAADLPPVEEPEDDD